MELKNLELAFGDRASGRTTRIIDDIIQKLYENYQDWVNIYDHYPNNAYLRTIASKVIARMELEHPNDIIEKNYEGGTPKIRLVKCSVIDYKLSELAKIEYKNQLKSNLSRLNEINDGLFNKVIDKICNEDK